MDLKINQESFTFGDQEYYIDYMDSYEKDDSENLRKYFVRQRVGDHAIGPVVGRKIISVLAGKETVEYDIDPQGWGGEFISELLEARKPCVENSNLNVALSPQVVRGFLNTGVGVYEDAVDLKLVHAARKELLKMYSEKEVCRSSHGQSSNIRTDEVAFVELNNEPISAMNLVKAFRILEGFAIQLQDLTDCEILVPPLGMVSLYPGTGSHYIEHLDNEKDRTGRWRNYRTLTMILYLNEEDFSAKDGGQLVCQVSGGKIEIVPKGGTCVIFDTRNIRHEVLPSHRNRCAMTLWFVSTDMLKESMPPCGPRMLKHKSAEKPNSLIKRSLKIRNEEQPNKKSKPINWAKLEREKEDGQFERENFSFGFSFN